MKAPRILLSGSDGSRINYENAIRRAGGIPCSFYCPQSAPTTTGSCSAVARTWTRPIFIRKIAAPATWTCAATRRSFPS